MFPSVNWSNNKHLPVKVKYLHSHEPAVNESHLPSGHLGSGHLNLPSYHLPPPLLEPILIENSVTEHLGTHKSLFSKDKYTVATNSFWKGY